MSTIKDVAETAQVSITTVSHVINGTRHVSDDLRERVISAMQALGYRPNALARSLRRRRTGTIGLILPDNANMFFAEVAREIEDLGFQAGYSVILCNTNDDQQKEATYTTTLLEKQVDGMIFISAGDSEDALRCIQQEGVPVVVVDRETGVETDMLLIDNFTGGYMAGQHLVGLGHRRLACISGPRHLHANGQRVEGFIAALNEANITLEPDLLVSGDFRYPSGAACMETLLDLGERRPSAVFVCNDMMAIGALGCAHRRGLSVPGDISIAGFDDVSLAQAVSPALTTVAQPMQEIARQSVELLFEQIRARQAGQPRGAFRHVVLVPHLVERDSCRAWP